MNKLGIVPAIVVLMALAGCDAPKPTPAESSATPVATPAESTVTPAATPAEGTVTPAATPAEGTVTPAATPAESGTTPAATLAASSETPATTPATSAATPIATPAAANTTPAATPAAASPTVVAEPTPASAVAAPAVQAATVPVDTALLQIAEGTFEVQPDGKVAVTFTGRESILYFDYPATPGATYTWSPTLTAVGAGDQATSIAFRGSNRTSEAPLSRTPVTLTTAPLALNVGGKAVAELVRFYIDNRGAPDAATTVTQFTIDLGTMAIAP